MAAKTILVFCAQVLVLQSVIGQCIGRAGIVGPGTVSGIAPGLAYEGIALGGCGGVASTGGNFAVTSASPIAPIGVSVVSDNAIEGALIVGGNLPLLGSVGVEGAFLTAGAGAVSYGCGDNAVAIVSEGPIATGIVSSDLYAPGIAGYGPGIGCGYGVLV